MQSRRQQHDSIPHQLKMGSILLKGLELLYYLTFIRPTYFLGGATVKCERSLTFL